MEFEIYIKDNCFLPDNTNIKINTKVFFKNTDSIRHTIHCNGHAYFPSLIIEAGHTAVFNFEKPGRYEISEAILGDMKCVIETMEQDRENIPRTNYFPTSKDKKKFLAEQELLKKKTRELAALLESTPTSPADFKELLPSSRDTESLPFKSTTRVLNNNGEVRSNQIYSSDSDTSNEDANISQQRRRVKASTSRYNGINPSRSTTKTTLFPSLTTIPTTVTSTSSTGSSSSSTSNTKKDNTTHKKLSTPTRNQNTKAMLQPSSPPTPRSSSIVRTIPCQIVIEDFEFSVSEVEVVVGQVIEFRLAKNVPGHAEHELFGVSTEKTLCFESPLLQQEECTKYIFIPNCTGEIVVSCKIFTEMSCIITVHPATTACLLQFGSNPTQTSHIMPISDNDQTPWGPVTPPRATPTTTSSKKADPSHPTLTTTPSQKADPSHPTPSTASPSEAYQAVAKRVMHLDTSIHSPVRGGGDAGELSESQSSFYDSDDIFSDCDVPLASRNLSLLFDSSNAHETTKLPTTKIFAKSQRDYGTIHNGKLTTTGTTSTTSPIRVTHIVTVEDYSFRPSTIVVRAGECVRFRQCAGLSVASLVCEGEFTSSLVNRPCSHLEGWEDQYNCYDHIFNVVGKFDVQNEIYVFSRCNVVVVPNSTFSETSSTARNSFTAAARKAGPPKLMGSFNSGAPSVPVFNKPAGSAATRTAQRAVGLTPTTSTTVNASTTSIVSTSAACVDAAPVHTATRTSKTSTTAAVSDSSPRHAPLYGSFLPRNTAVSPLHHVDASTEQYINDFITSTNNVHHTQHTTTTQVKETEENVSVIEDEISAAAAKKKAEKNRKKKLKTKEKQRAKKIALTDTLQEGEGESEGDPEERIPLISKHDDPDERTPLLSRHSYDEGELSPSAVVVGRFFTDTQRSKCYLQAQADWQEDFSEEEFDNRSGPMDVCSDEPVPLSSEVAPPGPIQSVRHHTEDKETTDRCVERVKAGSQPIEKEDVIKDPEATRQPVSNERSNGSAPDRSETSPVVDTSASQLLAEESIATTVPGKKKKKKKGSKTATKSIEETEQILAVEGDSKSTAVPVSKTRSLSPPADKTERENEFEGTVPTAVPTDPLVSREIESTAAASVSGDKMSQLPIPPAALPMPPVKVRPTNRQEQVQLSSEGTALIPVLTNTETPGTGVSGTADPVQERVNNGSTYDISLTTDPSQLFTEESAATAVPGKKKKKKKKGNKTATNTTEEGEQTLVVDGDSKSAASTAQHLPLPPPVSEKLANLSQIPTAVPAADSHVSTPPASPRSRAVSGDSASGNKQPLLPVVSAELQTPVKVRQTDEQLDSSFQTPPSTARQEESMSARNSNLLRSALRITPVAVKAPLSRSPSPLHSRTTSPVEEDSSVQLSLLMAYEQQIEEFFLSRYDVIESLRLQGKQDRLPSGKEVDILYLEDMHLKPVHKSKQRGKAHNTRDKTAAGSTAGKAATTSTTTTTASTTAATASSTAASTKSGRPPLPVTATIVAAVGQPKKRK